MNRYLRVCALVLGAHSSWVLSGNAQSVPATSQAQQVLATAGGSQKYTFLVFYKDNGPATQAMAQTVKRGVEARNGQAVLAFVDVANPVEKPLVDRFGVGRAPMPLTIAVAPNGAITSVTPKSISEEQIARSFVPPAMAHCMRSMQDGKLVLACVQPTTQLVVPPGVKDFCDDPQFKDRVAMMFVYASDRADAPFLQQLGIDATAQSPTTVFLAPPGVLVGKFSSSATKDQLAAALHKAGKCCEDENCKHNHHGHGTGQPSAGAARQQGPGARRN